MTNTLQERVKAVNELITFKTQQFQKLEEEKNNLLTEVVKLEGKRELLNELQSENQQDKD